jgi:hypothetical protein
MVPFAMLLYWATLRIDHQFGKNEHFRVFG